MRNAGFDADVSGWGKDLTLTRAASDADGCRFSGSLNASGYPDQCVLIAAGTTYNFGFSFQHTSPDDEGGIVCAVSFHDNSVCDGQALAQPIETGDALNRAIVPWTTAQVSVTAPPNARSAEILCVVPGSHWFLDKFFLTPDPGTY